MCGIVGAMEGSGRNGRVWVESLNRAQAHRGPDDAVVVQSGRCVLGNTRLAILEPTEAGNQPYRSADGRYLAVLNGEIYNYLELIERFRLSVSSGCDGAVILPLWERFGADMLEFLRGMYAVAVLDTVEGRLFLARDPHGIKPLHWRAMEGGGMAFSSEPRPLAALSGTPRVEQRSIARYLHLGALGVDDSPFEAIRAVPIGGFLSFHLDAPSQPHYAARRPFEGRPHTADGAAPELARSFTESVRIHLRSDVPTALLLSAGVDSMAIASVASRLGHRMHCLTVDGPGMASESADAASAARHYGHAHRRVEVDIDECRISHFFRSMQRPTIDGLNTFLVCAAVRDAGFKVALSGLGGDEALAGYRHAKLLPLLRVLRGVDRLPSVIGRSLGRSAAAVSEATGRAKLAGLLSPAGPRSSRALSRLQRQVFAPGAVERMCGVLPENDDSAQRAPGHHDGASIGLRALAVAEIDLYMGGMLLADSDAFSMAWSVELRVPFVDSEFFIRALDAAERCRRFGKRTLLRGLGDPYLLGASRRRKTGFGLPMRQWMENGLLAPKRLATEDPDAAVWNHLDRNSCLSALRNTRRSSEAWSIVSLNQWLESL